MRSGAPCFGVNIEYLRIILYFFFFGEEAPKTNSAAALLNCGKGKTQLLAAACEMSAIRHKGQTPSAILVFAKKATVA